MSESAILGFLKGSENVPYSVNTISKSLKIKKRRVFAICCNSSSLQRVNPMFCGSGRTSSSVFVFSPTRKWVLEKSVHS